MRQQAFRWRHEKGDNKNKKWRVNVPAELMFFYVIVKQWKHFKVVVSWITYYRNTLESDSSHIYNKYKYNKLFSFIFAPSAVYGR